MIRLYKRIAVSIFGRVGESKGFQKLRPDLQASGMRILVKTYASIILFTTVLAYVASMGVISVIFLILRVEATYALMLLATLPVFIALMTFTFLYYYPSQKSSSVRKSIDNDLPFALSHLSAIASSGISPEYMFELLTGFKEYKNISKQASKIVRNMRTLGMSSVAAINDVAESTPSSEFKQILTGITFNIEKGGNLVSYISHKAERALFDYRLKREKYLKTLSTYADIYAALLVAAPLMMLAVLGILAVIGGEILGMGIPDLIFLLTFMVLPALNITFIMFLHITYPGV